ncbi:MAG: tetratricopeptide repeat protein [Terriglobia bacterium]
MSAWRRTGAYGDASQIADTAALAFLLFIGFRCEAGLSAPQTSPQPSAVTGAPAIHSPSAELQVERTLLQAVEHDPQNFEANHRLGEFYLQVGKLKAGIPYLEKAQSLDPGHYVNGYDLALAYFETADLKSARRQIHEMLDRQNTAELHNLLGDVEEKAGNYVAAANQYQVAAQMDPSEGNIFDWGNDLLLHRGFDPAEKVFTSGVGRYPQSARLHIGLAIADYSQSHYDDAASELCRAADLAPTDPRPYLFLGQMFDISLKEAGQVTERLERFQTAQPNNARANYYYALSLWKGERGQNPPANQASKEKIESLLTRSIKLDPNFPDAHFQLGVFYSEQQKYQEAMGEFHAAVKLKPDYAEAHYHLAQAYSRTGKSDLAKGELDLYQRYHQKDLAEDEVRRKQVGQFVFSLQERGPAP